MRLPIISAVATVLVGLGVPLVAAGPGASGGALALALVLILAAPGRLDLLKDVVRGVRSPLGIAVVVMFVLWVPAVVDSLDPVRSLKMWARTFAYVAAVALLFQFLRRSEIASSICLRALVVGSVLCVTISLLGIYVWDPIYAVFRGKLDANLDAALLLKFYGSAVACLVPVVLWAGFRLGRGWRVASFAFTAMGIVLIFAVSSNSGLLGLVAGAIVGAATIATWHPSRAWTVP
ncbi:MAG: hypothetical protein JSW09_06640, partial [Pseudomonadota bacterium]